MLLSQLEERLPMLYIAACEPNGAAPYIRGPVGIGKTSVIRQYPKRMKQVFPKGRYGFIELNGAVLSNATGPGYLQFGPMYKGRPTSLFSIPWWQFTRDKKIADKNEEIAMHISEFDGGIIFIDEADKMGPDVRKAVGEAALSGIWYTHKLSDGWVIFFGGNRIEDRSGSQKDFDHLINRQRWIDVRFSVDDWAEHFAEPAGLLPEVITFARDNPTLVPEPPPEVQRPWCTPRSLHAAEIHLRCVKDTYGLETIPTDPIVEEEIAGGIGGPAAAQLMLTIREGQELPSYASVVASPDKAIISPQPSLRRLMAYKMADALKNKDITAVLKYITRYPVEFQVMFGRLAIHRDFERAFQPDMGRWIEKHAALTAVINRYKSAG